MSSFSQDSKWVEAKKVIGTMNWLEIISYYRSIGGKHVFVYSVVDGDKRLIVDVLDDERVLLINRNGIRIVDDYKAVLSSRKLFKYSENKEDQEIYDSVLNERK